MISRNIQSLHPFNKGGSCSCLKAVLVAIAIPIFSAQLEKSRDSTDAANVRSAYAEATVAYLDANSSGNITYGYNFDGKGTNAYWDQISSTTGTMEIGGVQVQAVSGGKGVEIVISPAGATSITIKTTAYTTEGVQS